MRFKKLATADADKQVKNSFLQKKPNKWIYYFNIKTNMLNATWTWMSISLNGIMSTKILIQIPLKYHMFLQNQIVKPNIESNLRGS